MSALADLGFRPAEAAAVAKAEVELDPETGLDPLVRPAPEMAAR